MTGDKKCKICRRAGEKLFLKGDKCFTPKCIFVKKPYPPGKLESEKKHKSVRSEYGSYLMEKQKVRNTYGVSENQFSNYVKAVKTKKGNPATALYESLEKRLDNVVFRLGLASSRPLARQLVSHGHITVNGRKVTIPSYSVSMGDKIAVREGSRGIGPFKDIKGKLEKSTTLPVWLKFNLENMEAEVGGSPKDPGVGFNLNSVIEFYSR